MFKKWVKRLEELGARVLQKENLALFSVNQKSGAIEVNYPAEFFASYQNYLLVREMVKDDKNLAHIQLRAATAKHVKEQLQNFQFTSRLKKVCQFYNSFDRSFKKSHRPLLLDDLIKLETLLKQKQNLEVARLLQQGESLIRDINRKAKEVQEVEAAVLSILKQVVVGGGSCFDYLEKVQLLLRPYQESNNDFQNSFNIQLKHQTLKVLLFQLKNQLASPRKFFNEGTTTRFQLRYLQERERCFLFPNLLQFKQKMYLQIEERLGVVFHFFQEFDRAYTQQLIQNNLGGCLESCYDYIESVSSKIKRRIQDVTGFDLQSEELDIIDLENETERKRGLIRGFHYWDKKIQEV